MTVKMLAFTNCGHCPLAIVKFGKKCEPMNVYCPLQVDGNGKFKRVFRTSFINKLDPSCPIPSYEKWLERMRGLDESQVEEFALKTRFLNGCETPGGHIEYSLRAFRGPRRTKVGGVR